MYICAQTKTGNEIICSVDLLSDITTVINQVLKYTEVSASLCHLSLVAFIQYGSNFVVFP